MALKKKKKKTGLRRRWMRNSMGYVIAIVLVALFGVILAVPTYYHSSMQNGLEVRATQAMSYFRDYTEEEYYQSTQSYISAMSGQNTGIDVQFLTPSGVIRLSSYGLTAGSSPDTPEIEQAVSSGQVSSWIGSDPQTGEHILAVSAPITYEGTTVGIIRYVTSLHAADVQTGIIVLISALIGLGLISMMYFSSLFFLRSIVEPISAINDTAKRIADGAYGIQIEKSYDDEIGELADTINNMSLKIRESEKVQQEFISSVSHELRTPLTAINGWTETILNGKLESGEDIKKGLNIIQSESRRLTNMVEELLEFSRITDGRFTLRVEPIDIKAELEDAIYTYKEFFRQEGIELIHTDCEEEFPPMTADPERLRQVFCNLLDNAAKHGGAGKRIDTSIAPDGEYVKICIRDYGPGIPEEELPYVKQKFYKGKSKTRGSGIGLAVCDEIITRHKGTLDIGNAEGGGCIATIRLPLHVET